MVYFGESYFQKEDDMMNRSLNEVIKNIPFTKEISKASDGVISVLYEQLL